MNKTVLLIFCVFFASFCFAAQPKVIVLNLNYDNGNISLLNSTVKYGFNPDRNYQADYGHRLEVVSKEDDVLYEFTFEVPNEIFVDGTNEEGELKGGMIVMDELNFALVVPYYPEMEMIRIYSPDDNLVAEFDFSERGMSRTLKWRIVGLIAAVTVILIIFIIVKHMKDS